MDRATAGRLTASREETASPRSAILKPLAVALFVLLFPGLAAARQQSCSFTLGFATLHDLVPDVVGSCVDDEQHDPRTGDALQHTTNGLLAWRKSDNWTAVTDGLHSWVNGPLGLQ